jgi:tetratricopeptide (TPR) repeat protein
MRSSGASLPRLLAGCLLLLPTSPSLCAEESKPATADVETQASRAAAPVFLATEYYPLDHEESGLLQHRLLRELARQAVLVAVRDELGLPTRDETLGEPASPSEEVASRRLRLETRIFLDGKYQLRLFAAEESEPFWDAEGEYDFDVVSIYPELAGKFAALATAEIAPALRSRGFGSEAGAKFAASDAAKPDEATLKLLGEMNFVSQFAAIRAAHRALKHDADSALWLETLIRGYTHLALLNEHLWSSRTEAFAARALLYAERLARQEPNAERGRWNRAYALALIGAHQAALNELHGDDSRVPLDASAVAETMPWAKLVEPYCRFQRKAFDQAAAEQPQNSELAALLQWELTRAYRHEPWIYQGGVKAMQTCPEAYGLYAELSRWTPLRISRTGAWGGPSVFSQRLVTRVAAAKGLPETVTAKIKSGASFGWEGLWKKMQGESLGSDSYLAPLPMTVSRELISSANSAHDESEPSWAVLGSLISEEQFVQAASLIRVSQNATEHSSDELISQLEPLVGDHRYWPFVASYADGVRRNPDRIAELFRDLKVVDPRGNMLWLFYQMWSVRGPNDEWLGWELTQRTVWSRSFTLPGLSEPIYSVAPACQDRLNAEGWRRLLQEVAEASPYSPTAIRLPITRDPNPTAEKMVAWRRDAGEDPELWNTLGDVSYRLKDLPGAVECYERSIEISPSYDAATDLAACYREQGQDAKWQQALEAQLLQEDLGLEHSNVHYQIAERLMSQHKWEDAETHAVAAANLSWSASGLEIASRCLEGSRKWEDSERWIAEAVRQYPTHMGYEWFFWCRRTGRGELEEARKYAEKFFAEPTIRRTLAGSTRMAVYRTMEDSPREALAEWQAFADLCGEKESVWDKVWRFAHTAVLADRLGEATVKEQALRLILSTAEENSWEKSEPESYVVLTRLCDALSEEPLGEKTLAEFDDALARTAGYWPCNYSYFMGAALEERGLKERAELYYRHAAFDGPFDCYNATLAGMRLVELHGVDRGGPPPEERETSEAKDGRTGAAEDEERPEDRRANEESSTDEAEAEP